MKLAKKKKSNGRKTEISMGDLYTINKAIVENNIPDLTKEEINSKRSILEEFIERTNNEYYMLLCNDQKDYTLFHRSGKGSEDTIGCGLIDILLDECIPNRGRAKSIDITEDKAAIEIWISINKESFCYYFFPYDLGIIEC